MKVQLIIKCGGVWLEPPLLDEPRLKRDVNAAAVLVASVIKNGDLSFDEGAAVRFLVDGEAIFCGRVFCKRRSRPKIIEITAYDELRYLQNRDCCVFSGITPAGMVKQIAALLDLSVGDLAPVEWRLSARAYDNRRYIDMVADALDEVLTAKCKHYILLAENGRICLRDCRDMQVDICLSPGSMAGYEYRTSIDENYANRVKLIYEDKRRGLRRQFMAEDRENILRHGVLQYVHKSAAAEKETGAAARQQLAKLDKRQERLLIKGALGDIRVRGGSMVGLRMDLGDRIVDSQALVKRAEHYFKSGVCLMDLELDASLL